MLDTERTDWSYEAIVEAGLDPKRFEIADGRLVLGSTEEPGMSVAAGLALCQLAELLRGFVSARHLGRALVTARFRLREDPKTERLPDLAFVREDRFPARPYPRHIAGPPDLAVEVLSPSDPVGAAADKAREYLAHGAQEVWNVDPGAETITVFRPGVPARAYSQGDELETPLLPGFSLALSELFG